MRRSLVTLVVFILMAMLFSLSTQSPVTAQSQTLAGTASLTRTATGSSTPQPVGVVLKVDRTYYHSTGLFAVPRLVGWELPPGSETSYTPVLPGDYAWASAVFFNNPAGSVIHVFLERPTSLWIKSTRDLDKYLSRDYFTNVWAQFRDGWKETRRRITGDRLSADFTLQNGPYASVSRQISRLDHDWVVSLRLVAPANNPQLLDRLENVVWPSLVFYPDEADVPLSWTTRADPASGYLIKHPTDWFRASDSRGVFAVVGTVRNTAVSLTVRTEPGKGVWTAQGARNWVTASYPQAKLLTLQRETKANATGYSIAYNLATGDVPQSAVVMLLNGANGTLYVVTLSASAPNLDFLSPAARDMLPEFDQVRTSFMLVPTTSYIPTPRPSATPIPPTRTPIPTAALDPGVFDIETAKTYKSTDGVIELLLPRGWARVADATAIAGVVGLDHVYVFAAGGNLYATPSVLILYVGEAKMLYNIIFANGPTPGSARAALEAFGQSQQSAWGLKTVGGVHPVKMGKREGFGVSFETAGTRTLPNYGGEIRVAELPDEQLFLIVTMSRNALADRARPVLEQMIDSLVIHPKLAPTATETPTPIPPPPTATQVPSSTALFTETPSLISTPTQSSPG